MTEGRRQQEFRSYYEVKRREEERRRKLREFEAVILGIIVIVALGWFTQDVPAPIAFGAGVLGTFIVGLLFGSVFGKEDE
jgi:hypothetical protein